MFSERWEAMSRAAIREPRPIQGRSKVLDYVMSDLAQRAEMGTEKYGTYLMTQNGRDPLWDAYQEVLDLAMYLRQEILERRGL
jgi:nucleoside phosphorylase